MKTVVVYLRAPEKLAKQMKDLAKVHGFSQSEIARLALERGLHGLNDDLGRARRAKKR